MSVCITGKEVAVNDEFIEEFECENNIDDTPEDGLENESDAAGDSENSDAAGDSENSLNSLALEAGGIIEISFSSAAAGNCS